MKKIASFFMFFSISFLFIFNIIPAKAIDYDYLGGRPVNPDPKVPNSVSWFIYNLDKGQQKEDAMYVINNFSAESEIIIYAADSVNSSNGGFALKQFVENKTEVGSWVRFYPEDVPATFTKLFTQSGSSIISFCANDVIGKYSETDITAFNNWCAGVETVDIKLPAKRQRELKFVFSVPKNVDVGEHRGGILIQKKEVENVNSGALQGVSLTTRVGIRIYETVPGDIVKTLALTGFKVDTAYNELDFGNLFSKEPKPENHTVSTSIENQGNVSVDFTETITITDELGGRAPEVITDRSFQALRADTFVSNYDWAGPHFGRFSFTSSIQYQDINDKTQTLTTDKITIWIIPWREIIIVVTLLLLVLIGNKVYKFIWKRKYGGAGWVSHTVTSADTLSSISRRYNVDWQTFVKTNNIKPPYTLKAGSTVKVPGSKNRVTVRKI